MTYLEQMNLLDLMNGLLSSLKEVVTLDIIVLFYICALQMGS